MNIAFHQVNIILINVPIPISNQVCAMVPTTECINIPSQLCDEVVEELCEDKCTPVWWCKVC